ncbi:hypothetical protein [Actinoplanes sp. NPDC049265]
MEDGLAAPRVPPEINLEDEPAVDPDFIIVLGPHEISSHPEQWRQEQDE